MTNPSLLQNNEALAIACRDSFRAYVCAMNQNYQFAAIHKIIASVALRVQRGELTRVILRVPPRHGKSELLSVMLPAFALGHNPSLQVIGTSYGQELSEEFGGRVRGILKSPLQQLIFPRCRVATDRNDKIMLSAGGIYRAVGMDGGITGRGADLAIIDDPHKNRQEANSRTMRDRVWNNFTSGIYTRLSPKGAILIVAARWHEDDLTGRCLRELAHENWLDICLPAISDDGEALWPERWSLGRLEEIQKVLGPYDWSALYQQRPTPAGGSILKQEWVRTYRELPTPISYSWTWDTAIKTGQLNDYTAGQLWAECRDGYYLVRSIRERLEYPELKRRVLMEYQAHRASEVLIEDKSSGQQLIQDFRRDGVMPVIGMMPAKDMPSDKVERTNMCAPLFEAGKVFIPEGANFGATLLDEWCSFPNAEHDDMLDATTQYLCRKLMRLRPRIRQL